MIWLISAVCLVAGLLYPIPALLRVFRARTTAGLSLLCWQLLGATTGAWVVHGAIVGSPAVALSNAEGVFVSVVLVALMRRERALPPLRTWVLPVVLFAALVAVRFAAGPVIFAGLIVAPQLLSSSGQFFELVRSQVLAGVSALFLWFGVLLQAVWLCYGFLAHDTAIAISAAATGMLALLNVVWYLLRSWGVVQAKPGFGRRSVADELDPPEVVVDADPIVGHPVG